LVGICEEKFKSSKRNVESGYGESNGEAKFAVLEGMKLGREAYWEDVVGLMKRRTETKGGKESGVDSGRGNLIKGGSVGGSGSGSGSGGGVKRGNILPAKKTVVAAKREPAKVKASTAGKRKAVKKSGNDSDEEGAI